MSKNLATIIYNNIRPKYEKLNKLTGYKLKPSRLGLDVIAFDGLLAKEHGYNEKVSMRDNMAVIFGLEAVELVEDLLEAEKEMFSL